MFPVKNPWKQWKINNFSDDLDYLEEVVKPDVIHICTPPQYHYEIIKRFYKKRIGIFVEKPFVLKKTEINDVIKNSSPKCLISCNHNYVYKKSIQRLLNFTTENNIRPKQIFAYYSINTNKGNYMQGNNHWSYNIPSGPIVNNISHPLSIINLFGGKFREININQKIEGTLDSLNVDIKTESSHAFCKIFMSDKYFDKSVTFIFDDFKVHCDLHRDTIYFYNLDGGIINDFLFTSLKDVYYSFRDIISGPSRLVQSITREMPDITNCMQKFYSDFLDGSETSFNELVDNVAVIDKIIKISEYHE